MTTKNPGMIVLLLGAASIGWSQPLESVQVAGGTFVPAGALLGCTLDEPNFSSRTARPGDPVLCRTTSLEMFGRTVIPRGAYLSARLRNYRDPGHFVGKGWLQLEFTSLTLPGGNIPIDAKVISAASFKVDGDGKIQGHGHATRDAVEWAFPILWPMKVVTLPARGPRPALKGETHIELRLMADLVIPESALPAGGFATRSSALQPRRDDKAGRPAAQLALWPGNQSQSRLPASADLPAGARSRPAMLVLKGGRMYLVSEYWLDNGKVHYSTGGTTHTVSLSGVDIQMTNQLNAERGVPFVLEPRSH